VEAPSPEDEAVAAAATSASSSRTASTSSSSSSSSGASAGEAGGLALRFALSAGGPPVHTVLVRRLLLGADGPASAVRRLAFDAPPTRSSSASSTPTTAPTTTPTVTAASPSAPEPARLVWRGRFTLRDRDVDPASLRRFMTATRTWLDLRAPRGAERSAWLSPAGKGTWVWSASCPAAALAGRALAAPPGAGGGAAGVSGGGSPYWRCLAAFEDFPQAGRGGVGALRAQ
jgi:hypothetical protein